MRRLWTPELEKWFREGAVVLIQAHMRSSLAFTRVLRSSECGSKFNRSAQARFPGHFNPVYIRNLGGHLHCFLEANMNEDGTFEATVDREWVLNWVITGLDNAADSEYYARRSKEEVAARDELKRDFMSKWPERRESLPPLWAYYVMRHIPPWVWGTSWIDRKEYIIGLEVDGIVDSTQVPPWLEEPCEGTW
eukprot:1643140-Prymnesium_polylepis.1